MTRIVSRLSLHTQLLASYILLLAISLGVIAAAVLVLFSTRPAPPEPTYQRLAALVRGLDARDMLREFFPRGIEGINSEMDLYFAILDNLAETRNVRVMWIYATQEGQYVLFDSDDVFSAREAIFMDSDKSFISPQLEQIMVPGSNQIYGSFYDPDGAKWLFGGIARSVPTLPLRDVTSVLLLAEPAPTMSLQGVLSEFGSSLLPPLVQAGLVGLLVAVLLAFWITRGIVRPLQALAAAATGVSRGDYDQQVEPVGPPEIQSVAQAFNRMSSDVRSTQIAQREFLANVSHDLKTPLTSIQGYSQAIIDGAATNPESAARIIYDEASRLNRMVTQLTDLTRIQSGRLSLRMTALDIGQITEAIGQRLAVVARSKGIDWRIEAAPMPQVAGDGDRMAQVLTNLLSNAIKFTPAGGQVHVKTRVRSGGVEVVVRDTGVGIRQENLSRIFDRFYQVDKARGPQRGTGLGLAITREIVHAHGGEIHVHSDGEGRGTTFTVWLPSPQLSTIVART